MTTEVPDPAVNSIVVPPEIAEVFTIGTRIGVRLSNGDSQIYQGCRGKSDRGWAGQDPAGCSGEPD